MLWEDQTIFILMFEIETKLHCDLLIVSNKENNFKNTKIVKCFLSLEKLLKLNCLWERFSSLSSDIFTKIISSLTFLEVSIFSTKCILFVHKDEINGKMTILKYLLCIPFVLVLTWKLEYQFRKVSIFVNFLPCIYLNTRHKIIIILSFQW